MCDRVIAIHSADPVIIRPLTSILPKNCLRVPLLSVTEDSSQKLDIGKITSLGKMGERDLFVVLGFAYGDGLTLEELEKHSIAINNSVHDIESRGHRVFGLLLSQKAVIRYVPSNDGDPIIARICSEAEDLRNSVFPDGKNSEVRAIRFAPYFLSEELNERGVVFHSSLSVTKEIREIGGTNVSRSYASSVSLEERRQIEAHFN